MWGRRTRRDAIISERQLLRIRVIDAVHPLFGQPLEVSPSGLIRRIGWIRVVLPDGRHRWVPQKATDLNVSACEGLLHDVHIAGQGTVSRIWTKPFSMVAVCACSRASTGWPHGIK